MQTDHCTLLAKFSQPHLVYTRNLVIYKIGFLDFVSNQNHE
jgi:hypothetical protein